VDLDRAGVVVAWRADAHLERDRAVLGQDQRAVQGQFGDGAATDLLTGA
jgi:hypothetical protein